MKHYQNMSREELLREVESLQRQNSVILMTQKVALRESEDRYRRMIETANEGVWVLDAKGITTFVNNKMGVILGYHADEMLGRHVCEFMDEESREIAEEKLALRKMGVKEVHDFRFRSKEGYVVWTLLGTNPIYDHDNRYVGSLAMVTDITDRKRAEEALRESEARYRAMVEAFPGLTYICSPDYRIEFLNERFKERLGRDATGENCFRALHGLDTVCPWCVNTRVQAGELVQWEVKSPRDQRWYAVANTPIHNTNGTVSKHALITDINERKAIEEELTRKSSILRKAVNAFRFGTWEWEAESETFRFCEEAAALQGTQVAELSLDDWLALGHPDDRAKMGQTVREALAAALPCQLEFRSGRDGELRQLRMMGEVVDDAEQKPAWLCGVLVEVGQD